MATSTGWNGLKVVKAPKCSMLDLTSQTDDATFDPRTHLSHSHPLRLITLPPPILSSPLQSPPLSFIQTHPSGTDTVPPRKKPKKEEYRANHEPLLVHPRQTPLPPNSHPATESTLATHAAPNGPHLSLSQQFPRSRSHPAFISTTSAGNKTEMCRRHHRCRTGICERRVLWSTTYW